MSQFKVGDVVQLKSGGPKMTVLEVNPAMAYTTWFAGSKNERGNFPIASLQAVKDEPSN